MTQLMIVYTNALVNRSRAWRTLIFNQFKYLEGMLLVAFLLLMLLGCSPVEEPPKSQGLTKELPLAEYRDTTILDMYEGSRLSWILKTLHLVKWPRTDLVRARPVDLIVYDSTGKIMVRVTADSGTVDESISFLVASGHVHGHSEKGVDITSDSLRWNKAINQISTEAHVRVISEEGDVLTGKGFLSDAKLDNWQILSNVHGVFQKVQERFQDADKDSTASPAPGVSTSAAIGMPAIAAPGKPSKATIRTDSLSAPATKSVVPESTR